jgi:two-component system, response regulator YesN
MYKMLIVDDEKLIRKGLIAKLAHNDISFAWIGEASNGNEAIALIEANHPDIVITDIRMPVMDGIELMRCCYEGFPNIKFIILSGYAEFEYAKQALNMGAIAYLLKPIDENNLVSVVTKAASEIEYLQQAKENAKEVELLKKDLDKLLDKIETYSQVTPVLEQKNELETSQKYGSDCKKIVENVIWFIENNYTSEITVLDLAKKYAINPDYLSSVFKQKTGKNIIKYLMEIRIERACKLLRETQLCISDISYKVGYMDRQYFNRVFKKIMGIAPIEYRNKKEQSLYQRNLS